MLIPLCLGLSWGMGLDLELGGASRAEVGWAGGGMEIHRYVAWVWSGRGRALTAV